MVPELVFTHIREVGAIAGVAIGFLTAFGIRPRVYFNPISKNELFASAVTGAALAGVGVSAVLSQVAATSVGASEFPWAVVVFWSVITLVFSLACYSWVSAFSTYHANVNGEHRPVVGGLWRASHRDETNEQIQEAITAEPWALVKFYSRGSRATAYSILVVSCVATSTSISSGLFFSTAWLSAKSNDQPNASSLALLAEEMSNQASVLHKAQRSIAYDALSADLQAAAESVSGLMKTQPEYLLKLDTSMALGGIRGATVVLMAAEASAARKIRSRELVEAVTGVFNRSREHLKPRYSMSLLKAEVIEFELASAGGDDELREKLLDEAIATLKISETLSHKESEKRDVLVRKAQLYYAKARPANRSSGEWDSAALTAANTIVSSFSDQVLENSRAALSIFMETRLRYVISERGKDSSKSLLALREDTLQRVAKPVSHLLDRPAAPTTFGILTNYSKLSHDQAYSQLDPNAPEDVRRQGLANLDKAEKAMELAVAYLDQGEVSSDLKALHGDYLLDLARSRALRVEYLKSKQLDTHDAVRKIVTDIQRIDETNVTTVEKRRRLLADLVIRPEWSAVCMDSQIQPLTRYAAHYSTVRNGCL